MSSRRDSGASSSQSGFFCLSNVQGDWQTLKDLLRSEIRGQPGWVDFLKGSTPGQTDAYFSVKTEEDADKAYYALTNKGLNGVPVGVHRFNDKTSPPALVACNCQELHPGCVGHLGGIYADTSGVTSHMMAQMPQHMAAPYYATAPAYAYPMPANTMQHTQTYMAVPYAVPIATTAYSMQSVMAYATPQYQYIPQPPVQQMRINANGGTVPMEARGIFISNIDQSTTQEQLEAFLRERNARPISVRLPRDRKRARGHATVLFDTGMEAQNAMIVLDGQTLQGKKIRVRMDQNATVVESSSGPLVVNGSSQGTRQRR
ncbi:hypothetical protein EJ05DRAFT_501844 [Pseudovirgaria hyperparasitica]|uniref:RRM domain-containing protein n=1 Tax=Pseudovirgaria hyperparasitica TaxID=470096 RepID=A0A6A6W090_9PEZI|nr:uncharacterized protein EJ05DRAFT_501844 [Pseudovirgaria hyperparasitica]KAF2756338.1 hypothetical protein EJ05DRAFT_501844 [Pseudovirgaria hyperparasitica]